MRPIYRMGVPLPSRCCILYIFFQQIYVQSILNMLHTLRFSLQNAVYFIMLPFLVHVLFTFYIQVCWNLNVKLRYQKVKGIAFFLTTHFWLTTISVSHLPAVHLEGPLHLLRKESWWYMQVYSALALMPLIMVPLLLMKSVLNSFTPWLWDQQCSFPTPIWQILPLFFKQTHHFPFPFAFLSAHA